MDQAGDFPKDSKLNQAVGRVPRASLISPRRAVLPASGWRAHKAWPKEGNNLNLTTLLPLPSPAIEMIISPSALDIQVL